MITPLSPRLGRRNYLIRSCSFRGQVRDCPTVRRVMIRSYPYSKSTGHNDQLCPQDPGPEFPVPEPHPSMIITTLRHRWGSDQRARGLLLPIFDQCTLRVIPASTTSSSPRSTRPQQPIHDPPLSPRSIPITLDTKGECKKGVPTHLADTRSVPTSLTSTWTTEQNPQPKREYHSTLQDLLPQKQWNDLTFTHK